MESAETAVLPSLSLFDLPYIQSAITDTQYIDVNPLTTISDGVIEFSYTNHRAFLALDRSYLHMEFKVTLPNGDAIPAGAQIAVAQHIGSTACKQMMLYLNGKLVCDSGPLYAYRSYIAVEFGHSTATRSSLFEPGGYYYDEQPGIAGDGYTKRKELVEGSKVCGVMAPLFLDICQQPRVMLNFVDLRLQVFMNENSFILEGYPWQLPNPAYKLQLIGCKLKLKEIFLHDTVTLAIEKLLQQEKRIQYPHTATLVRSTYITGGRYSTPDVHVLTNRIPNRILFGFVKPQNYNGSYSTSPFVFEHANVRAISVQVGSTVIPCKPWRIDFAGDNFVEAYTNTLESLNVMSSGQDIGLSMKKWKNTHCLHAFNLSPATDTDLVDLIRRGNTTLKIDFSVAVPAEGYYLITYVQNNAILSLDASREPVVDSIV